MQCEKTKPQWAAHHKLGGGPPCQRIIDLIADSSQGYEGRQQEESFVIKIIYVCMRSWRPVINISTKSHVKSDSK